MPTEKKYLRITKSTRGEILELSEFINKLSNIIADSEVYDLNKTALEIAEIAITLPDRAFLVPLNLDVMLSRYQDEEVDYIETPKWIKDLYSRIEYLEKILAENDIKFD